MEHLGLPPDRAFIPEFHGNNYDPRSSFQGFPQQQGWELDTSSGELKPASDPRVQRLEYAEFMQSWLFFGLITAVVYDEDDSEFDYDKLVTPDKENINTKNLPTILQDWRMRETDPRNAAGQKMRMIRAQIALDLARKVVIRMCSFDHLEMDGDYIGPMHLAPALAMSLMVIGETLTNAKARIIKQIGFHVRGWYGDAEEGWGTPEVVIKKMRKSWCPRTIKLLRAQLGNNATALLAVYISHPPGTFQGDEHKDCDESVCRFKSEHFEHRDEYATRHHATCLHGKGTSECSLDKRHGQQNGYDHDPMKHGCRGGDPVEKGERKHGAPTCYTPCHVMMGLNMSEVVELIESGKIPLVKIVRDTKEGMNNRKDFRLELTDTTRSPEYATISHVWSDGYGNMKDNKLYRCQLDYFCELLGWAQKQRMQHRRGQAPKDPEPLPFWMDTLLIPVQDTEAHVKARKKAIHQIYSVFSNAKYTIVLDNGLKSMEWNDNNYTTMAMRILASGWMRRLWTLQEAFLSRKLLFVFHRGESKNLSLVDLDAIEDQYDETDTELVSNLPAIAQSYYNNLLGPDRKARIHNLTSTNGVGLIASVWRAAQWRTTSHKEHETLALATLLNLNLKKKSFGTAQLLSEHEKLGTKLDEMMKDFWLVLEENSPGAIPPGIIFLPGTRIRLPGFGWAPTTWMSAHGIDHPDPISLISRPATLAPQNRGLSVEYPGFLLHYENKNAIIGATDGQGFWFPSDNTLTEWYHAEWADLSEFSIQRGIVDETRTEALAIILCRPRPRHIAEIGLLVEIHETIEQRELGKDDIKRIFAVYILRRITLKRESAESRITEKRKELLDSRTAENQERIICGEVLEESQRWYVDRRTSKATGDLPSQSHVEQPHSIPMARGIPFSFRESTEANMQAESELGTSRAGTEATDHEGRSSSRGAGDETHSQANFGNMQRAATEGRTGRVEESAPEPGIRQSRTWQTVVGKWFGRKR